MIIDFILDKKQSTGDYNPYELYSYCMEQLDTLNSMEIARALDSGTEDDVKRELINYLILGGYITEDATTWNKYAKGLVNWINNTYWL